MIQYGLIDTVSIVSAGTSLRVDANSGDTVLAVDDAIDFNELGGSVEINGTAYDYDSADLDSEDNTITLATGLLEDLEVGQPVYIAPAAYEKRASVMLADNGDTLDVRVPHSLYDRIPEGIRESGASESVTIDLIGNEWVVTDIIGRQPSIDGSYIDPATVPEPATDGLPPASVALLTVIGGINIISTRWSAVENSDPVTYKLHMSTTQDFTPDSTTLLNVTPGLTTAVRTLPDNTPLQYDTDYFFRVIASDADGDAEPSAVVSARLFQVNSPDMAANYIYAGQILADQIVGGTVQADLTLSSTIKTADTGARVEMSPLGLLITDSTGAPTTSLGTDGTNFFKGDVEANGLTVLGGATFRSTTNELSRAAVWTLAAGITNSTNQPTVQVDWEKIALEQSGGTPWPTPGNLKGLARNSTGQWMAADPSGYVHTFDADGTFSSTYASFAGLQHVTEPASGKSLYGLTMNGATCSIVRLSEEIVFSDDFSGTLANWPNSGTEDSGTVGVVSGKAQLYTPTGADYSLLSRTLEGSFKTRGVEMKVDVPSNASAESVIMTVESPIESTRFQYTLGGGVLQISWTLDALWDYLQIPYDGTQHAYLKIYELNNRINFQTSPDGATWTTQQTVFHGRPASVFNGMEWKLENYGGGNAPNLITNSSFATNTAGWSTTGLTTITRTTSEYYTSPAAGLLSRPTQNSHLEMNYQSIAVTAGHDYKAIAQVKGWADTNRSASYLFNFYDSSGALLDSITAGEIGITTSWTDIQGTATAPTGAVSLVLTCVSDDASTTSFNARSTWDDIRLIDATTAAVVVTGDNAKYSAVAGGLPITRINTNEVPALGSYTTTGDLLFAEHDAVNNKIQVRRISTADLSTVVTTFNSSANPGFAGPLAGVLRGNFDFPEERYIVTVQGSGGTNWWPFKNSDGTYQSNDAFPVISGGCQGIGYDGTNFWSLGSDGNLYKHTNIKWSNSTDSATWNVGYTWYDGGTQETTPSPYRAVTMKMRARLTVTSPAIPYTAAGDPDRIRIYIGRGTGTKYRQTTTASMVNTAVLTTATFSGTAAPTTNTFLSATPAKIRNTDDSLIISADGSIKAKTLDVTDNPYWFGYQSSAQAIATGSVTVNITGWVSDGSPNSAGGITQSGGVITIPKAGRYRVTAQLTQQLSGTGGVRRYMQLFTGSGSGGTNLLYANGVAGSTIHAAAYASKTIRFAAGDTFRMTGLSDATGGTSQSLPGPQYTYLQVEYVGP